MKVYRGTRSETGTTVTVDGQPLALRLDLGNHSPTGFEWGYWGSGPAQLALAILADHLGDELRAVKLHQDLRFMITGLPDESWMLTSEEIQTAVEVIEVEKNAP